LIEGASDAESLKNRVCFVRKVSIAGQSQSECFRSGLEEFRWLDVLGKGAWQCQSEAGGTPPRR
jgi:hypothetical protein